MPLPTHATTNPDQIKDFDKDIKDVHLIYDYDAKDENGKPEKWRYEMCVSPSNVRLSSHFIKQPAQLVEVDCC